MISVWHFSRPATQSLIDFLRHSDRLSEEIGSMVAWTKTITSHSPAEPRCSKNRSSDNPNETANANKYDNQCIPQSWIQQGRSTDGVLRRSFRDHAEGCRDKHRTSLWSDKSRAIPQRTCTARKGIEWNEPFKSSILDVFLSHNKRQWLQFRIMETVNNAYNRSIQKSGNIPDQIQHSCNTVEFSQLELPDVINPAINNHSAHKIQKIICKLRSCPNCEEHLISWTECVSSANKRSS